MLVSEEDIGILWVSSIFAATHNELNVDSIGQPITVTIDDCECPECDIEREPIEFDSTLLIHIPTKNGVISQRLTPSEAQAIGKSLLKFSQEIIDYKAGFK
jgi:hypothetical protein